MEQITIPLNEILLLLILFVTVGWLRLLIRILRSRSIVRAQHKKRDETLDEIVRLSGEVKAEAVLLSESQDLYLESLNEFNMNLSRLDSTASPDLGTTTESFDIVKPVLASDIDETFKEIECTLDRAHTLRNQGVIGEALGLSLRARRLTVKVQRMMLEFRLQEEAVS